MIVRILCMILVFLVWGEGILSKETVGAAGREEHPGGPMAAVVEKDRPGAAPRSGGALDIRIHGQEDRLKPPAELLLIDIEGRRIGRDPRTGEIFSAMPNAFYEYEALSDLESGAPGPETAIVYVGNPLNGEYTLRVIGKEPFRYTLELRGYDGGMGHSGTTFDHVPIHQHEEHTYLIRYSNEKGSRVEVTRVPPLSH
jgi:hypothetical protein